MPNKNKALMQNTWHDSHSIGHAFFIRFSTAHTQIPTEND